MMDRFGQWVVRDEMAWSEAWSGSMAAAEKGLLAPCARCERWVIVKRTEEEDCAGRVCEWCAGKDTEV